MRKVANASFLQSKVTFINWMSFLWCHEQQEMPNVSSDRKWSLSKCDERICSFMTTLFFFFFFTCVETQSGVTNIQKSSSCYEESCSMVSDLPPEQRRWSVWRMCWGGPPPAAAWPSQNAGGRCEHRPWTGALKWSSPHSRSSSWTGHLVGEKAAQVRQKILNLYKSNHQVICSPDLFF